MGSSSAMSSIDRVLETHGEEIERELLQKLSRETKRLVTDVQLENNVYEITVTAVLTNGTYLALRPIDIDTLAQDYPDCKVGY